MATGQKRGRGRLSGGGIESAGAGVSGMTTSQGVSERQRFDREVYAADDEEEEILRRGAGPSLSIKPDKRRVCLDIKQSNTAAEVSEIHIWAAATPCPRNRSSSDIG
jgi:hypothetical protein